MIKSVRYYNSNKKKMSENLSRSSHNIQCKEYQHTKDRQYCMSSTSKVMLMCFSAHLLAFVSQQIVVMLTLSSALAATTYVALITNPLLETSKSKPH